MRLTIEKVADLMQAYALAANIQSGGREKLGDAYPVIISVIDTLKRVLQPDKPEVDVKDAELNYEQSCAIKEANRIAQCEAWFAARPQIDTLDRRRVFESGFDRGFDAATSAKHVQTEVTDAEAESALWFLDGVNTLAFRYPMRRALEGFLSNRAATSAKPAAGPGTAKWRLTILMAELEQRFPSPKPLDSTRMPEAYALEAIDKLIADSAPQPAELTRRDLRIVELEAALRAKDTAPVAGLSGKALSEVTGRCFDTGGTRACVDVPASRCTVCPNRDIASQKGG